MTALVTSSDLYVSACLLLVVAIVATFAGWLIDVWPTWRQRRDDFRAARRMTPPTSGPHFTRDPSPTRRKRVVP